MKHRSFGWKHFGILLSVGILAAALAIPAVASSGRGTLEAGNTVPIEVSAYYEMPTYSVELSWGSMEFKYLYGVGWDYSQNYNGSQTFNQITLTNLTSAPVGVDLKFEGNSGIYTGTFNTKHDGEGDSYDALYFSANKNSSEPTGSVYLILNDVRPVSTDSRTIGQITLKLVDVLEDSKLTEFEYSHASNKIGHVTRDYRLVTFDRNNLER